MDKKNMIKQIALNYKRIEDSYAYQLGVDTPNHYLSIGSYREKVWLQLFEQMIPKKFRIAQSVFIIDSFGTISPEIDILIYDEQYTPYIFQAGNQLKFIPIEAVAVAVQCKSENVDKGDVDDWAKEVKSLKTILNAVVRLQTGLLETNPDKLLNAKRKLPQAQTSTRPILILCKLNDTQKIVEENFDIILSTNQKNASKDKKPFEMSKKINNENKDLAFWHYQLNHYNHEDYEKDLRDKLKKLLYLGKDIICTDLINTKLSDLAVIDKDGNENVILSLTFQLNQLLMLLNNPLFFPHQSYADLFDETRLKGETQNES
ncbi:DUF6602 domain-containing protein [Shouchella lehensis]|uniref:DUF6602 domain-containing protein n=1 Tax=Shouchella lehensis TaxID=300825 RepID=A0A4Y7WMQ7_9BACI|nr:DUF6602 domain-containing protein [Shouchella lehensis]MBG9782995.1 hypothetical protein [Shouchella lehensis]TES49647.1 hypothetical protein E2L03_09310 [Shouchella lehensis]